MGLKNIQKKEVGRNEKTSCVLRCAFCVKKSKETVLLKRGAGRARDSQSVRASEQENSLDDEKIKRKGRLIGDPPKRREV